MYQVESCEIVVHTIKVLSSFFWSFNQAFKTEQENETGNEICQKRKKEIISWNITFITQKIVEMIKLGFVKDFSSICFA